MPQVRASIELDKSSLANIDKMLAQLEELGGDTANIINVEAKNTVRRMERDAPIDTGRLSRNIEFHQTDKHSVEIESEAIDPETGVDYAPIQEFGLGNGRNTPYFFKNIRRMKSNIIRRVNRRITKILKR